MDFNPIIRSVSPNYIEHQIMELYVLLDDVHGAMNSLDPHVIGQGLATYRPLTNRFEPRTKFMQKSASYQSLSNLANPDATCSNIISGLEKNHKIALDIIDKLTALLKHANSKDLQHVFAKIEGIQKAIDTKTGPCITALLATYTRKKKDAEQTAKISNISKGLFDTLKNAQGMVQSYQNRDMPRPEDDFVHMAGAADAAQVQGVNLDKKDKLKAAWQIVSQSQVYMRSLARVENDFLSGLIMPLQLVDECQADACLRPLTNKEAVKQQAIDHKPFEHVSDLPAQEGTVFWRPLSAVKKGQHIVLNEHAVVPTCTRDENNKDANHLPNLYIQVDPKDHHVCITCGGIDTRHKADEFIEGLKAALEYRAKNHPPKLPMQPLRIVLHQVNSFFTDGELILNQHQLSRYMESELRKTLSPDLLVRAGLSLPAEGTPLVAHINTALNFASTLNSEEKQSNLRNLDGLAAFACWMAESLPRELKERLEACPSLKSFVEKTAAVKELRRQIMAGKEAVCEIQAGIEKLPKMERKEQQKLVLEQEKQMNAKQAQLTELLRSMALEARMAQEALDAEKNASAEILKAQTGLKTLSLILAKQTDPEGKLGLPEVTRTTELELHLLLHMLLIPVNEINCKSGLDRTGFARALWDSLRTLHKNFASSFSNGSGAAPQVAEARAYREILELVLEQDKLTEELDHIQGILIREQQLQAYLATDLANLANTPAKSYRKMLIDAIEKNFALEPMKADRLFKALAYQDMVAHHLIAVGQPITQTSTGA